MQLESTFEIPYCGINLKDKNTAPKASNRIVNNNIYLTSLTTPEIEN